MSAGKPYIHYAHVSGEMRVFSDADGYKNRVQYDAIVSVLWLTQTLAQLQGAHGRFNQRSILATYETMLQRGAERLMIKRAKGRKLPYGELIETGAAEDTYLVNLLDLQQRGLING